MNLLTFMDRVTFDIETVANPRLYNKIKISGAKDKRKAMATDPWFANVVSIGALEVNGTTKTPHYFGAPEMEERELLDSFWNMARNHNVFVTFNGCGFDVPVLQVASARHGIDIPVDIPTNKYNAAKGMSGVCHFDLQLWASEGRKAGHRLENLAAIFDVPGKKGDGAQVAGFVKNKQWKKLREYQIADVELTDTLFERIFRPKTNVELLCEEFYRDAEGVVRFAKRVKWGSETIEKDSIVSEYPRYLDWLANKSNIKPADTVKVARELLQR